MKEIDRARRISQVVDSLSSDRALRKKLRHAFDSRWYMLANPDVASSAIDPFKHYLSYGLRENRAPNAIFSPAWYLTVNPDVASAKFNPLLHYLTYGHYEGRFPHPLFDGEWYLRENPDVRAAGANPLIHFVKHGAAEHRRPSVWFDPEWYLTQTTDAYARENPFGHFLTVPAASALSPFPLFDSEWYNGQYSDIRDNCINPLMHYVLHGALEGRDPNMLFDTQWYLKQAGDEARHNPLLHYITVGAAAGLTSHPMFDGAWYIQRYPDVAATELDPLSHYYRIGRHQGRSPHPSFDAFWYISQPHAEGVTLSEAFRHYLTTGLLNGYAGSNQPDLASINCLGRAPRQAIFEARPTVLIIAGRSNTETDLHIHQMTEELAPDTNSLIMKCSGDDHKAVEFQEASARSPVRFDVIHESEELIKYLNGFNLRRASVYCSASEFGAFKNLNQTLKLPYDVTLYDYSLFGASPCPIAGDMSRSRGEDAPALLDPARAMIEGAKKVFVPSRDMLTRIQSAVPLEKIDVTPLLTGLPQKAAGVPRLKPGKRLNVAVLWNENDHSQIQTISEVRQLAEHDNVPIHILLVGRPKSKQLTDNGRFPSETGEYTPGELAEILIQYKVHAIWYPCKILEAFSLTLSEGLSTGLPILVPNLGPYPERVANRPWSFVADWKSTPSEWLEKLAVLRDCVMLGAPMDMTMRRSGV